ncbi:PTS system N-acetylgalactosamine-specific IIA component [Clostridium acetobutylicum]|uniref:PTS system, fructose(Mannose)-specific IIA component n=1 Tax=Clostridium acetobutylicum (strain ATCC 824 / DSM 792 / JCM 1419 / IAM 19013 / LMG 5710 / NBRC 13948 / NRRL B-527 / VKM B-1787 / 2291 / W) TaxID=272562 RepID=Q97J29_CLOAB|nr:MULTISPECIES: PTS sugar transporter subunit IIA [Clostridium]AAK79425.1 PTS system, fructose(mannose)-specific IIA component [Clostridium acetobutylicum ATCC 824]ADZ20510.1 PTS system, fructose(mannose)-specific IIA component [Clostridium acetobutylicum EA 2018]AEI31818.1 PTS system, fructose(mannose)-specific IIA component [Clostridium acetobutylicum DSM 1731]AWV81328.1 PTS fructose transporter subunit IIA [Clostridium acetobutylicum]MBC2392962.1 PTS sugar transporter subunit IIA [Clostrid
MRYVILVSHGQFASGLYNALSMLAGKDRNDVIFQGLEDGMSTDKFGEEFNTAIENVTSKDEIILFGDIIGGSPLTTAVNILASKEMLSKAFVLGGMNLPVVLTAILMKDSMGIEELKKMLFETAEESIKEFKVVDTDKEDDI